jgi:hypothetical protein
VDRASEITINQSSGKNTRRHSRQKSSQGTDAKAKRSSLQGKRWRFPRGLDPQEVETRISRLCELQSDHEQFCQNQIFVAPEALANHPEVVLEEQSITVIHRREDPGRLSGSADETATSPWVAMKPNGYHLPCGSPSKASRAFG